jgi:26S proteasome non-ATPase regulatory subunit 9
MSNSIINASENGNSEEMVLRKELARIDIQRRSMEHEADAIVLELTTPPEEGVEPMGMDTPLIDVDGYPRGDVDILRARTLRQRFQILKNDHKAIEQNIDGMLTRLAAMKVRKKKKNVARILRSVPRKELTNGAYFCLF